MKTEGDFNKTRGSASGKAGCYTAAKALTYDALQTSALRFYQKMQDKAFGDAFFSAFGVIFVHFYETKPR